MPAISVHGHQVAGKTKFMENYILFFIYTPSKPNNIKNLKDISFYYICLCVGGEGHSTLQVLGIKLRPSGLLASPFPSWTISVALKRHAKNTPGAASTFKSSVFIVKAVAAQTNANSIL